jgi:hypothetical protein
VDALVDAASRKLSARDQAVRGRPRVRVEQAGADVVEAEVLEERRRKGT